MTLLGLPESTQSRGASSIGTWFILRPAGLSTRVATIASANSRPEATMPAEITWPLPVIRSPHSSSDRCTRILFDPLYLRTRPEIFCPMDQRRFQGDTEPHLDTRVAV